ncbi:MAG: hypothetical protein RJA70_845 [Pseudomonadota bacterium]|jgi:hypothetical protein
MIDPEAPSFKLATQRVLVLGIAALCSVYWTKLSLVTALLTLIAWLSLPAALPRQARRLLQATLLISAIASGVGFLRFVLVEAVPGVIAGGQASVTKHTIAYLRTVIAAQDRWREHAPIDHDRDGIGSAASFGELSGLRAPRGGSALSPPPFHLKPEQLQRSPRGELVAEGAYLFQLCLPLKGGGFSADSDADRDDELAERRYLLYAWPRKHEAGSPRQAYFADEHETILVSDELTTGEDAMIGTLAAPACDSALPGGALAGRFRPWKDKAPRAELPGDTSR